MATPAWLQQEVQPAAPPAAVSAGAPPPEAMDVSACANDSKPEPAQAKFANAPGFVVPAPSFSYTVLSNASAAPAAPNQARTTSLYGVFLSAVFSVRIYCRLFAAGYEPESTELFLRRPTSGSWYIASCRPLLFIQCFPKCCQHSWQTCAAN